MTSVLVEANILVSACFLFIYAVLKNFGDQFLKTLLESYLQCSNCSKEFGMEIEQQPARYDACGHFKVCVSCAKTMWKLCNYRCPTCGLHQSREPRSMLEFTQFCEEDD